MPRRFTEENQALRRNISAWTRKIYAEKKFQTKQRMADVMGVDMSHLSTVYNGTSVAGLDFVFRLSTTFSVPMDDICKIEPEEEWFPPPSVPKRGVGRPPKEPKAK